MLTTAPKSQCVELIEHTFSPPSGKIDRAAGVIFGVKILGRVSKNGREYSDRALKEAAALYENMGVNANHPSRSTPNANRTIEEGLGWLENVTVKPDGVYGDLNIIKAHPMANALFEIAERKPDRFGLSHNASGEVANRGGKQIVENIKGMRSVDIVQNPATVNSLFESHEGDTKVKTQATELGRRVSRMLGDPGRTNREKLQRIGRAIGQQFLTEAMVGEPSTQGLNGPVADDAGASDKLMFDIKAILAKPDLPDAAKLEEIASLVSFAPDDQPDGVPSDVPESHRPSLLESWGGRPAPGSKAAVERAHRVNQMIRRYK